MILECESLEQAQKILSELPLVQKSLVSFDLIPLTPYPGFERLFSEELQE